METLSNIGFFALLFFTLVFVHELGHFMMAKWVGIKVERFSIGMGPAIFSFKIGETEYRVAWMPLGGYVKMAGDDPGKEYSEEERKRGFLTQKPPAKLLVVFGGPVMNLILPIFLYAAMLATGIPHVDTVIGSIKKSSPADYAGLISGDRILSLDGKKMNDWKQMEEVVKKNPEKSMRIEIERLNVNSGNFDILEKSITPILGDGKSRFGEDIKVGQIGVSPEYPMPRIYFEDEKSALAMAGLKPLDTIVSVNGIEIKTMDQWQRFLSSFQAEKMEIAYRRGDDYENLNKTTLIVPSGSESVADRIGLLPVELVVSRVTEDGAAAKAGVQAGDRVVSIAGKKISHWEQVPQIISESDGKELPYVFSRAGKLFDVKIAAEKTKIENPVLGKDDPLSQLEKFRIGIAPEIMTDSSYDIEQSWNPVAMFSKGIHETWSKTSMTLEALFKLVTGQLSAKSLGSPIMIYKVAGNAYRMAGGGHQGWISFLTMLAWLSITLGIMNILPIPVLDGGHAVFFIIEWIRGKPLGLRTMEIATQVGLIVIGTMFVFVIYNDVNRYELFDKVFRLFQ